ncbi:MAG: methylated-DNA--[protein]-cysteine S-methyltransferase [Gammaproteobacteria bacterium]|nr:methylated-DNA--[protein]-cysteine S-methyltransferase [Gammaproteobacteria bacterium]
MPRSRLPERFFLAELTSPIGTLLIVSDAHERLRAVDWMDYAPHLQRSLRRLWGRDGVDFTLQTKRATSTLRTPFINYFAGDLRALERLEVHLGGTSFQREVWSALRAVPVGHTLSYGAFATQLDRPRAVRAVGHANGANPISVVVPCHRLIGANGSLTGYAGGLARKQWLLRHEGVALA